jgi:S-formylglutathione hydrolase FrmB
MKTFNRIVLLVCISIFSGAALASEPKLPWDAAPLKAIDYRGFHWDLKRDNFRVGTYFSKVMNASKKFTVALPPHFQTGKPVQIIYFLGGGNGTMYQLPLSLDETTAEFENILIVAPDSELWGLWADTPTSPNTQIALEFIDYIESQIPHTAKRLLIGHSNGGAGSLHMAFLKGSYFDAVVAASPTLLPWSPFSVTDDQINDHIKNYCSPDTTLAYFRGALTRVATSFGDEVHWNDFDLYRRLRTQTLQTPVGIFTGAKDSVGFFHLSQLFVAEAKKLKQPIEYFEQPDRDHSIGDTWTEIVSFLLKKSAKPQLAPRALDRTRLHTKSF